MNEDVIDALAALLWDAIHNEPGYLLREPGGGCRADLVIAWLVHDEHPIERIVLQGEAPAVWRTPRSSRQSFAYDDDPTRVTMRTDEWRCQNVFAAVTVDASRLPGVPFDPATQQVRVVGAIYERPRS